MIKKYEDIIAWQKAKDLTISIYALFKTSKDWSFRDQLQRASISIMNNIAEGYERKGRKEFIRFLYIAKGSCGEVKSMLTLSIHLNYLDNQNYERLSSFASEISKILTGLIQSLENRN